MKSIRLNAIAKYINEDDKIADIGCDHGYLGILALKKGVKYLQLIDNKQGPLDSAIQNFQNYDTSNVLFTLSSGLDNLNENVDTIIIAGMGGHLITDLLNNNIDKAKKLKKIILQANTEIDYLRNFLDDNFFKITDESIIYDNYKYYEIIVCSYDDQYKTHLSDDEKFFGPLLLIERSKTFLNKWNEQILKLENIKNKQKKEISSIDEKINYIKNAIKI